MTEELKTLKDIDFDEGGYLINDGFSDRERLKQEAIKWIKAYENKFENDIVYSGVIAGQNIVIIDWIKHFFNISEDDLK